MTINLEVAAIALDRADGAAFEKFAKVFFAAMFGVEFVPLGNLSDGGADGLTDVFGAKNTHFIQVTRQEQHRPKIRHTIERLRQVGRTVTRLTYITSRVVGRIDQEQELLADELSVGITIRDREYILAHLNSHPEAIEAFNSYLMTFVGSLLQVGATPILSTFSSEQLRSAAAFLSQEIENREGKTPLSEKIIDSLVIWALRETEPEKGKFLTREQIQHEIVSVLPSSKTVLEKGISARLHILGSKQHPVGRQINVHKGILYCLPFKTRETVQAENATDEVLREAVLLALKERAEALVRERGYGDVSPDQVSITVLSTIERGFEKQGLSVARWISKQEAGETQTLTEIAVDYIKERGFTGQEAVRLADVALTVIRFAFYSGTEAEKKLFHRWAKTYALLFSLQNEPRIVDWMRKSSSNFYLYLGSDIIIRALTERYLPDGDQIASNALKILTSAGSTLVLAEPVLEEVWTHIIASDAEFQNHYAGREPYISSEMVQAVSRPLIRTYFYAKKRPLGGIAAPAGWMNFVDGFVPYRQLRSPDGRSALKQYLLEHYRMEFVSREELFQLVSRDELTALTADFLPLKKHKGASAQALAENDALMVLSVYGKRRQLKELHKPMPFGYRAWWLTTESFIRHATRELVEKYNANYMMRPEYVLHYIALNPHMDAVNQSFNKIFPSILGLSLGARVPDEVLHKVLEKMDGFASYNDARLKVELTQMSNNLMSDFGREYGLISES